MHMTLLGALITLAPRSLYHHDMGSALADQQVAGMVMLRGSMSYLAVGRSEEHTSELQSLMRISSAVFCLNKHTMLATMCVIIQSETQCPFTSFPIRPAHMFIIV